MTLKERKDVALRRRMLRFLARTKSLTIGAWQRHIHHKTHGGGFCPRNCPILGVNKEGGRLAAALGAPEAWSPTAGSWLKGGK